MYKLWFFVLNAFFFGMACAQDNRIDIIGPDAPELADFGEFDIGVRTVEITIPNSIDVLNTPRGGESVLYDRTLTLEIWYPANLRGQESGTIYKAVSRNPDIVASLNGSVRTAAYG